MSIARALIVMGFKPDRLDEPGDFRVTDPKGYGDIKDFHVDWYSDKPRPSQQEIDVVVKGLKDGSIVIEVPPSLEEQVEDLVKENRAIKEALYKKGTVTAEDIEAEKLIEAPGDEITAVR